MSDDIKSLMIEDEIEGWDDDENVDLTPPSTGGKKHFAHLKVYRLNVTKIFVSGHYITIPGVKGGNNDEQDENGDKKFKGWLPGHKEGEPENHTKLFVLVATHWDSNGDPYQVVKQYSARNFDKDKRHYWAEFVYPAIKSLNAKKLSTDGLYVQFDDVPTGDKFTPKGETEAKDVPYWGNYKVYPDKAALDKANEEFFAQFKDNGKSEDFWPETWVASNSVEKMVEYAKTLEGNHAEIATALMLNDATAASGDKVNVALVLSKCLDVPEPMIQL